MRDLAIVPAILCLGAGIATATPTHLNVVSVERRTTDAGQRYTLVRGALSGAVRRSSGTSGTYKVPFWLGFAEACAAGIVEPIHFGDGPSFLLSITNLPEGTDQGGAPFEDLLDGTSTVFRAGRGEWLGIMNLKYNLEARKGSTFEGIPIDASFHIEDDVEDRYFIIADASLVERRPKDFLEGKLARLPCAVPDVIAVGYSQTGYLLHSFWHNGLNTSLATDPAFHHGLVFEGAIQDGGDPFCDLLDGQWFVPCDGVPRVGQGKVISVNEEMTVLGDGAMLRDPDGRNPEYRVYEIAGVAHIPTYFEDFARRGMRTPPPEQSSADFRPVRRMALENMRRWIAGVEPPPSVTIELDGPIDDPHWESWPYVFRPRAYDPPLFDSDRDDYDLNTDGGIRMPYVRTKLPNGAIVGGPLGTERGNGCLNPQPIARPFECTLDFANFPVPLSGDFVPYTALELGDLPDPCAAYQSHADYTRAVVGAAVYAAQQRWILPEEIDALVDAAEKRLAKYPGCVPE
jgi:hypothetical protein